LKTRSYIGESVLVFPLEVFTNIAVAIEVIILDHNNVNEIYKTKTKTKQKLFFLN